MGLLFEIVRVGTGFRIMLALATLEQERALPTREYCVLETGDAVNVFPVALAEVEASHVYVLAPLPVKVPTSNGQILTSETVNTGLFTNPTEIVLLDKQLLASELFNV